MRNRLLLIVFFFMSLTIFAEDSPLSGWQFNELSLTLNGRRFGQSQVAESWCEQEGYAIVQGRRLHYWLYDTISYHGGNADDIYNRYIPYWVEKMEYVIDYDHIKIYDPNPGLASSVQALMQQRGCDISVALIVDGAIYEYIVINEWFKSKGVYKTTIYPLYNYKPSNNGLRFFGVTSPRGILDLGVMSETVGRQKVAAEFDDFSKISLGEFAYGDWNLFTDHVRYLFDYIEEEYPQPQGHLFKVWYDTWVESYNRRIHFVGFVHWIGDNNINVRVLALVR